MALNTTNVKEWYIISNLSSIFTKNGVPSDYSPGAPQYSNSD